MVQHYARPGLGDSLPCATGFGRKNGKEVKFFVVPTRANAHETPVARQNSEK
jgi:hypothetical protein